MIKNLDAKVADDTCSCCPCLHTLFAERHKKLTQSTRNWARGKGMPQSSEAIISLCYVAKIITAMLLEPSKTYLELQKVKSFSSSFL